MAHKDFIEVVDGYIINLQNVTHIKDNGRGVEIYFNYANEDGDMSINFPISYTELKKKLLE